MEIRKRVISLLAFIFFSSCMFRTNDSQERLNNNDCDDWYLYRIIDTAFVEIFEKSKIDSLINEDAKLIVDFYIKCDGSLNKIEINRITEFEFINLDKLKTNINKRYSNCVKPIECYEYPNNVVRFKVRYYVKQRSSELNSCF